MALSLTAFGQSVPNGGAVSNGQIWSATQWNSAWQSKADTNSAALTGSPTVNGVAIGTVSSVSATAVAPLCVSGVPITSTGTLSITWCSGAVAPVYGGTGVAGTITGIPKANGTSAYTAAVSADVLALWTGSCSSTTYPRGDGVCATPAGGGGVSSVGLTGPGGIFSVSGSPVTTSGTITLATAGTSGGVPYFSSATTLSSSAALTANALVLGGGAGASPSALGSLGATTTVLHGNAAGAPSFGAVNLGTDVSNTLPAGSGGTGSAGGITGVVKANGSGAYTVAGANDIGAVTYPITSAETAAGFTTGTLNTAYVYYNAKRYLIDMTGTNDSTTPLSQALSLCQPINFPPGTVKYSTVTMACGGGIKGASEYGTIFSTTETGTANSITLTTSAYAPVFTNFTMQPATTKSGGYAIAYSPASGEIQESELYRVAISGYPNGIAFNAASSFQMIACDIYNFSGDAILVNNTNNVDSGDSAIIGTTFVNNPSTNLTSNDIEYKGSGGLKISTSKFLNGGVGVLLNFNAAGSSTGGLFLSNNSIENQAIAGIELSESATGSATWTGVNITGNEFEISTGGTAAALLSTPTTSFLNNLVFSSNVIHDFDTSAHSAVNIDYVNNGNISGNTLIGSGGTSVPITLGSHNTNFIRGQNQISGFGSYNSPDINAATAPVVLAAISTPLEIYGSAALATVASIPVPLDLLQKSGVIDATLLVNHAGTSGGTGVQITLGGNVVSQWYPASSQLGMSFKTQIVITPDLVSGINNGSSATAQMFVQSQNPTVTTPYLTSTTANYGFTGLSLTGTPTLNVNLQAAVGDTITLDGAYFTYHQNSGANFANANAVATWGDSLTAGVGASNSELTSYPGKLFTTGVNVGRVVYNGGISGQTSSQINTRAVQDNVRNKWTTIYWYGRNDCCTSGFQSSVLSALSSSIAHLSHSRYLVLSVMNEANEGTGTSNLTNILAANAALAAAYPSNYLDIRTILSTSAINTVPIVDRRVTASTTATYANGATSFTVASATGITNGMYVTDTTGSTIADQTTVTISGTTVTLSAATTGSATSGTVNFVSPTEVHLNDAGYAIVYSNVSSFLAVKSW